MIDKDFINDSFIPEKPGQLLKEMKNDYVKGGLISEGIFNMVPSTKNVRKHYPQLFHFWLQEISGDFLMFSFTTLKKIMNFFLNFCPGL